MRTSMNCKRCGVGCVVETRGMDDGIWTAFCSPEHADEWQHPLTEQQVIEQTSGPGMPYDRCQWCGCTLKSGHHEDDCPVRAAQRKRIESERKRD